MDAPVFFALVSNLAPVFLSETIPALALECGRSLSKKPALINLDSELALRRRAGRGVREDPVARYGGTLGASTVPVLCAREAAVFFEDARKPRNAPLSEGRVFIALMRKAPDCLPLFDALCFAVAPDGSSNPFVYAGVKTMLEAGVRLPVRVLVVGDARIERSAEFFAALAKEMRRSLDGFSDFSFCGHLSFDPEEMEIAGSCGLSVAEGFPEGAVRGQARNSAQRLFVLDPSETDGNDEGRYSRMAEYLASISD